MSKQRISTKRTCLGFGEFEGKCTNTADSPRGIHWCRRCDDLRVAHISRQFEGMLQEMKRKEDK